MQNGAYGERRGGKEGGGVIVRLNTNKLRPYDNARAGALCMLNPISLSGVCLGGSPLAGRRHVAS